MAVDLAIFAADHLNNLVEWMVIDLLMKWDECRYPPHTHAADPDHAKFCKQVIECAHFRRSKSFLE